MKVASVFQDHMVLQRDRPVPVWGQSEPGSAVEIRCNRKRAVALAAADGSWRAVLPPMKAAGPVDMEIKANRKKVLFKDVWIGEVWVASGQSNMAMIVQNAQNSSDEIAAANFPAIRVLTSARVALTRRQDTLGAGSEWKICSPSTVGAFTAAGYFFARELHQNLGVAIGIIDSSWGGTVAEAWTSRQGLQGNALLKSYVDKLDRFLGPEGELEREAAKKAHDSWEDSIPKDAGNTGLDKGWASAAFNDSDWKTMDLPTGWQLAGHDYSGVFWFRRELNVPGAWAGRDLELHVGACDKRDWTYFNGEFLGSMGMEDRADAWSTPRVYTVPGRLVKAGRNMVTVRVFSNIYQGGMTGPKPEMWAAKADAKQDKISLAGAWKFRVEQNYGKVNTAPPVQTYGDGNANTPTVLFNGMIAPLVPYAIRGFIWYQGESNAGRPAEYRYLFPNMIRDWRREWGREDLSFYFVQLANFMAKKEKPVESDWAQLREAQRQTLAQVPGSGMAVIIDIGEAADIHPHDKQGVGRRLAACALARDYGKKEFVGSSPLPSAVKREVGAVRVTFDFAGGGLAVKGETLSGFALAGFDRVFVWAKAAVTGPAEVRVECPEVAEPHWVRYGWSDNPDCNLYGGTGLPASPFESAVPGGSWLM